ncbi:MAG TPA: hypothetical protein VF210_14860 [Pseudomonadales bacterium]
MPRHKHYTFRTGEQVLEHAVRHLRATADALEALAKRDNGARVQLLLDSIAPEQRRLLDNVERVLEEGSDKLLNTYTQYTVEMPTEFDPPDENSLSGIDVIQWLQSLNEPLREMFEELADNRDSEEASEAYAALAQQLEAHEMRLSKEYQRTEDL